MILVEREVTGAVFLVGLYAWDVWGDLGVGGGG